MLASASGSWSKKIKTINVDKTILRCTLSIWSSYAYINTFTRIYILLVILGSEIESLDHFALHATI